jgi:hypothetical protein
MNLARHAAVLWRFRAVTVAGLLLGILLAIFASYKLTFDGAPSLAARGASTYSSESSLLVTQAGFPEGRVVLPTAPALGTTEAEQPEVDPKRLEFADPNRFMALADLYTKLIVSDEVRRRIPERPAPKQITASPLPAVSGAPILPIIQLTTRAGTPAAAKALNEHTADALRELLQQRQSKNGISPAQSVEISTLNAASAGVLFAGPSHTASILALILCLIGTVAVTHLLAALRPQHDVPEFDDVAFDWTLEDEQGEFDDDERDEDGEEPDPIERSVVQGARRDR